MEYFLFSVLIISVIGYSIYLITKKKENTDAKVSDANNSIKFEAIKNSSNEHENKSDFKESFSFKGKGTKNPTLINVYNELQKRLDIWRERYSEFEYPNRIVINMIYQSLQLEVIWNNLNDFTSKPFYQDYNQASSFVENEKNKYNSIIQKEVQNKYEHGGLIGNLNIDVYKELVAKAQKGDVVALEKITEGFLWYSGAFELGVVYCSLLKSGTTHQFAIDQICEIQTGININNLSEVQTLFGNNISMLFKEDNILQTPEVFKYCELCGKVTSDFLNVLIIPTDILYNISHESVVNVDHKNLTIKTNSNSIFNFSTLLSENIAVGFNIGQNHIFCSNKCVEMLKSKVLNKFQTNKSLFIEDLRKTEKYFPIIIESKLIPEFTEDCKCDECNNMYKRMKHDYKSFNILNKKKFYGDISNDKSIAENYEFCFSDRIDGIKEASWFMYKINHQSSEIKNFCSLDCVFNYSLKYNKFIMFRNIFEIDSIKVVIPELKEINFGLKNKLEIRPLKVSID